MTKREEKEHKRQKLIKMGLSADEVNEVLSFDDEVDKTSEKPIDSKKDREQLVRKLAEFVNADRITKPKSELYFHYNGTEYRLTLAIPRK